MIFQSEKNLPSTIKTCQMKWIIAPIIIFLSSCSGLPKVMQNTPYTDLSLSVVKTNISAYKDKPFRWGGKVINVINKENISQIQILFHPLDYYGRPRTTIPTEGRFAISSTQFLDPAVYKKDTEITVSGVLTGEIKQQIGEKTLVLPLLSVQNIHLWPKLQQYNDRYYPYYPYYPFYNYYYPYHPYNRHHFHYR